MERPRDAAGRVAAIQRPPDLPAAGLAEDLATGGETARISDQRPARRAGDDDAHPGISDLGVRRRGARQSENSAY